MTPARGRRVTGLGAGWAVIASRRVGTGD